MLDLRFRPLEKWPGTPRLRGLNAPFGVTYNKILLVLQRELLHMRAKRVVVEAGFSAQEIRNDGWPRSGAAPRHQGVILYFSGKTGDMRMPSGTYKGWQMNLYAIALTLERLRAIDRYGVSMGHEQYVGFKALPPASGSGIVEGIATVEDAAAFIAVEMKGQVRAANLIVSADTWRAAYRSLALRFHPDHSGSQHMWYALQRARELLDRHHGIGAAAGGKS